MLERLQMNFFNRRVRKVAQEILVHDVLVSDVHVSEAASLLVLSKAGVRVDGDSYDMMIDRLAAVKDRLDATPEQMQQALYAHELSLACED